LTGFGGNFTIFAMATMNISLPDEMKAFVETQVASGLYANASDYVRDVIRDRQVAFDRLRALLDEGDASGISPKSFDEILDGIKERHPSSAG
jgi:antitoxin ParD1/3/4